MVQNDSIDWEYCNAYQWHKHEAQQMSVCWLCKAMGASYKHIVEPTYPHLELRVTANQYEVVSDRLWWNVNTEVFSSVSWWIGLHCDLTGYERTTQPLCRVCMFPLYSSFIQQAKDMHVRLTCDSKWAVGVNVYLCSPCERLAIYPGCTSPALWQLG